MYFKFFWGIFVIPPSIIPGYSTLNHFKLFYHRLFSKFLGYFKLFYFRLFSSILSFSNLMLFYIILPKIILNYFKVFHHKLFKVVLPYVFLNHYRVFHFKLPSQTYPLHVFMFLQHFNNVFKAKC